jgi:hypothetical protein
VRASFGGCPALATALVVSGLLLGGLGSTEAYAQIGAEAEPVVPPLFASDEVLPLTITTDLRALVGDRRTSPDRPAVFTVPGLGPGSGAGTPVEVPGEVRTRGAFRLDPSNCSFPPLRIDIDADVAEGTELEGQDHLKLVSSCRPGRASYDELVRLEYLVYRTHALVADVSFRTRWIELTLVDETGAEDPVTRSGFLIEQDDALAERFGAVVFDLEEGKGLPRTALDPSSMLSTALFQYMIGNSDWSDVEGHNVELLDRGGVAVVVPYDFDFTGLVDAPYATPPTSFQLSSVRERVYRGWCANPVLTARELERFRSSKDAVLTLWRDASELDEDTRRRTVSYLEEFYEDIETDERANRRFLRDCRA